MGCSWSVIYAWDIKVEQEMDEKDWRFSELERMYSLWPKQIRYLLRSYISSNICEKYATHPNVKHNFLILKCMV